MAQVSFIAKTGLSNPLGTVNFPGQIFPTFVDIDKDGKVDCFIGLTNGTIAHYKNMGTAAVPSFMVATPSANPLNGVDIGEWAAPAFVDIDNDNDFDCFIGSASGRISFYKNTSGVLTATTGSENPFDALLFQPYSTPSFVDIDADGDKDCFVGGVHGYVHFLKNNGTPSAAMFLEVTDTTNPFSGIDVGQFSTPAFLDADKDGDFDAVIGEWNNGAVFYFKNDGTSSLPNFNQQTGVYNPFNSISIGGNNAPATVDINGDSKFDVFIGSSLGVPEYYENASLLPVELVSFTGYLDADGKVHLSWATASERDNAGFEIQERTATSSHWEKIGFVGGQGVSDRNSDYKFVYQPLQSGLAYYRLRQVDFNGGESFSPVVVLEIPGIGGQYPGAISIFPNPVGGSQLTVKLTGQEIETVHIQVYNQAGQLIKKAYQQMEAGQALLDMEDLSPGLYWLKIFSGDQTWQERIIRQ